MTSVFTKNPTSGSRSGCVRLATGTPIPRSFCPATRPRSKSKSRQQRHERRRIDPRPELLDTSRKFRVQPEVQPTAAKRLACRNAEVGRQLQDPGHPLHPRLPVPQQFRHPGPRELLVLPLRKIRVLHR